jgi:hypothetical protein
VLAHQYTSQLIKGASPALLDSVLGNVGTTISFRVGTKDADLLKDVMAPRVHATDLSALQNYNAFIRSSGNLGNVPFLMRMMPPSLPLNSSVDKIRDQSQSDFGCKLEDIDQRMEEEMTKFRAIV